MEFEDEEAEQVYRETIAMDLKNINEAMNNLIDSVSKFKSIDSIEQLSDEDFAVMLAHLDYARFMVSGVMYLHGRPICGHDHNDEE